ncbi:MAG: hypothetical protein KDA73_16070 [Rhodobacteraceae bacterium]|nr:hypothetical protein [Paracoccaceae bacterium]
MPEPSESAGAEAVRARFPASRAAHVRGQVVLAALAAIFAAVALFALGSPHVWMGPFGAVLAIGARGIYLAPDEISQCWTLTANGLIASDGRTAALREIDTVRRLGSAVQVVTRSGDKFLLRHLSSPQAACARIAQATEGGKA